MYTDDKTYKVLHLDFSAYAEGEDVGDYLIHELTNEFRRNAINFDEHEDNPGRFLRSVITKEPNKSIVLLIDEYDAPLTKALDHPEEFEKRRAILSSFYNNLKQVSNCLRFIFITGITRYAHVSIFSEFNNLKDLSLNPKYGTLLGYTQDEIEFYFRDYIEFAACELNRVNNNTQYSYDSLLQLLKQHYNGYCFEESASTLVYNPWSILNFLDEPSNGFKNYWVRSGASTPTVLVKYLEQKIKSGFVYERFLDLDQTIDIEADNLVVNMVGQNSEDFSFEAVLYQTGYLSIKSCYDDDLILGIPNLEVKKAYSSIILNFLKKKLPAPFDVDFKKDLRSAFKLKQFDSRWQNRKKSCKEE